MRLIRAPIGIVAGLIAGFVAKKAFERLWAVFDAEEPPEPADRSAGYARLIPALLVEGAIFRLAKGLVERLVARKSPA